MGVIPNDGASAADQAGQPQTLWQKFAQALDRLVVNRSHRAVPAMALRRSKHDHDRCRRMMHTLHTRP